MTDDPFTGADWDVFVKDVTDELIPKIDGSAIAVTLVPKGPTDVKFAVELGFMIMMDKPIIAVVAPGVRVPDKLRAVADAIVIGGPGDTDFQAKFTAAMRRIMPADNT